VAETVSLQSLAKGEQESSECHRRRTMGAEGTHWGEWSNTTATRRTAAGHGPRAV